MQLTGRRGYRDITFPLVSSKVCNCPGRRTLGITVSVVDSFLLRGSVLICVIVFSGTTCAVKRGLFSSVTRCVSSGCISRRASCRQRDHQLGVPITSVVRTSVYRYGSMIPSVSLSRGVGRVSRDFTRVLLHGVSRGNVASTRYCGGTGVSHGLFSGVHDSVRCEPDGPATVTFTVTLRLPLCRARSVLGGTKFTLSRDGGFSVVVRCFVAGNGCGVRRVGRTLFTFSRDLLKIWDVLGFVYCPGYAAYRGTGG